MKKVIFVLVAFVLCLSAIGCAKTSVSTSQDAAAPAAETAQPAATPAGQ